MAFFAAFKDWVHLVKRDVVAVYFAARNPATPLPVRLLALGVAAYALSPIDLIPDFIPVIGYLDDFLIVTVGLALVVRLLPPQVLAESRAQAEALLVRPRSITAAVVFVFIWIASATALFYWLM